MNKKAKGFRESSEDPNGGNKFKSVNQKTLDSWVKKAMKGNVKYQMKYTNYFRSAWNHLSTLPDSTMIHERDYEPMNCCICGKEMNSIHDTHNPSPINTETRCTAKKALEQNLPHRCCTECDESVVIPERIKRSKSNHLRLPLFDFFNQEVY